MAAGSVKNDFDSLKENVQQKFVDIRKAIHMREKLLLRQIDAIASSQQQLGRGVSTSASVNVEDKSSSGVSALNVEFFTDQEEELLLAIRSFGRFQLGNINLALQDDYLKNEDYITPVNDHETMYKCLSTGNASISLGEDDTAQPEAIVVDFSHNKSLIENNTKHMNKSIINITLQEAKELIKRAKLKRDTPVPPLNLEELDDELESSIAEAVSSLAGDTATNAKASKASAENDKKAKKSRFKPKITINNCNGTINLRNISNLTINCATEDAVSAEIPIQDSEHPSGGDFEDRSSGKSHATRKTKVSASSIENINSGTPTNADGSSTETSTPTTMSSSSAFSSNSSSRSQSKKQKQKKTQNKKEATAVLASTTGTATEKTPCPYEFTDDKVFVDDNDQYNDVTCDFYNRLLNEIKNSLKEKSKRTIIPDNTSYHANYAHSANGNPSTCDANSNSYSTLANTNVTTTATTNTQNSTAQSNNRRLILKNFENLKIILEANGDDDNLHPVQIEQWLAEIVSETDLEPMQNTDILEHSTIYNEST